MHGFVGGRLLIRPRLNLFFQHQLVERNQAVRPTSFMDNDERSADQSDPPPPTKDCDSFTFYDIYVYV